MVEHFKKNLVDHFLLLQWGQREFRLLKSSRREITDPDDLTYQRELSSTLKEVLLRETPDLFRQLTTREALLSLLDQLESAVHEKRGNERADTEELEYLNAETGEIIRSKGEVVGGLDWRGQISVLAKIPSVGQPNSFLETLIGDQWFPTTFEEDDRNNRRKIDELLAEPGTTEEVNFFNYFTIIPTDEVIPAVYPYNWRGEREPLLSSYPSVRRDGNIDESNYLQYTSKIPVSDEAADLLEEFNQKWGLLEPNYDRKGSEGTDLRGNGYLGGLQIRHLERFPSIPSRNYLPGGRMLRWSHDLLTRLALAKLPMSHELVNDLMALIYRPQPWSAYHNRKESANAMMKHALIILTGQKWMGKKRLISYLAQVLEPSHLRELYFDPRYSKTVFGTGLSEGKLKNYRELEPLLQEILEAEDDDLIDHDTLESVLKRVFSLSLKLQQILFGDVLTKIGSSVDPENLGDLVNQFPLFALYLPEDYFENLESETVKKVLKDLLKRHDSDSHQEFIESNLHLFVTTEELNRLVKEVPKSFKYLDDNQFRLIEPETLALAIKAFLPKYYYRVRDLLLPGAYFGLNQLTVPKDKIVRAVRSFRTPESLLELLRAAPNAVLLLDDDQKKTLGDASMSVSERIDLLGSLSQGFSELGRNNEVRALANPLQRKEDLLALVRKYPRTVYFLMPNQLELIDTVELSDADKRRIKRNLNLLAKKQPAEYSLTSESPQTPEFLGLLRSSNRGTYGQTAESIARARAILEQTDLPLKEKALRYYPEVPTLYQRRLDEITSDYEDDDYYSPRTLLSWDPERQLSELAELESTLTLSTSDESGVVPIGEFKIERDPEKRQEIINFFRSGITKNDRFEIEEIYRISVPELTRRWKARANPSENQKLLWHGTGKGNLLSIMAHGLKMPDHPGMFGRGIYFAPLSLKSLGYSDRLSYGCHRSDQKDEGWLLYNLVDMGRVFIPNKTGDPRPRGITSSWNYDSLYAQAGTLGLQNDEMVIYDPSRVLTTHLVKIVCKKSQDIEIDDEI